MRATHAPVFAWYDLLGWIAEQRADGFTLSLAWGLFGELDRDELDYLTFAAAQAQKLIVLVDHEGGRGGQRLFRAARLACLATPDAVGIPEDGLLQSTLAILPEVICTRDVCPAVRRQFEEIVHPYGGKVLSFSRGWETVVP